jgi:hypothetical protein
MTYVLGAQREAGVRAAFDAYREYLKRSRDRFPPGGYGLAASDWSFVTLASLRTV